MLFKKHTHRTTHQGVEAIEGIIQFQSIRLNVYCYAVDGVLIDTGAKALHKQFRPFLDEADVDYVVLSHNHEDHTGNAYYVQQTKNIPVYMSGLTIPIAAKKPTYPLYRQLFWGRRTPFQAQPLGATFQSRTCDWDVILTPGHAKDHVSFYNRTRKQLFSGDLFVTPKTKLVLRDESIGETIASLNRVLAYDFDEVFCQHAGYLPNGRILLEKKRAYLVDLQEKVWAMYQQGLSEEHIHAQLFPRKYPLTKVSGGEWDSKHIVHNILNE